MVFINCSYCMEPLCVINYKVLNSDKMVLRNYQEECPSCKKTLDFLWHENSDQIFDEEKLIMQFLHTLNSRNSELRDFF